MKVLYYLSNPLYEPSSILTGLPSSLRRTSDILISKRDGRTDRLIIDEVMKRAPCIAGRATTCDCSKMF